MLATQLLGHRSLNDTMIYAQLISFKDDDFTTTVAHSEEEACKLVDAGFDYEQTWKELRFSENASNMH
jgi:hypothetical protein